MNFYEHQHRARRRTVLLGAYFVLAVVLIVVAVNAVIYLAVAGAGARTITFGEWLAQPYWGFVTAAVLLVIVGNTLWTSLRLAGGGPALARMLGARRVEPDTLALDERRLRNVVEEMSIASGVPVPTLYVLDHEAGINAFVAGTRVSETVMVVTRGALETFSRDELQGVVAHEYSHIFNRDMHLNIQLMGALAGLLVIGQLGRLLLHSGSRGSNRNTGQAVMIGVALLAVGYIGSFVGAVIKAAISRQREFLADASAVQYTRNPDGIANALYRIETHASGSLLDNRHAEDVSHFCISEPVRYAFSAVMATHPPLAARIKAINPRFVAPAPRARAEEDGAGGRAGIGTGSSAAAFTDSVGAALSAAGVAAAVGTVTPSQVGYARDLCGAIPADVMDALHSAEGAIAVIYALVLKNSAAVAYRAVLATIAGAEVEHVERLGVALEAVPAASRLPLVQLAMPALKVLAADRRREFLHTLTALIEADQRFSVFEFALRHLLVDHLDGGAARARAVKYYKFAELNAELRVLLSALAHAGSTSATTAGAAFAAAWRPFALGEVALLEREDCGLDALDRALEKLAALSPLLKRNVIRACADCVIHDFTVTVAESELLQAIAINLDCPLPPLTAAA